MRTYSYHFYLYVSDPWLVLYQSLDQLIDFWSRTLLELFIGVLELSRERYPLILHLVSYLKFKVVNFETESQIVRLFHVVPNMPHRTVWSGSFVELVGEIIEWTWWLVVWVIRTLWDVLSKPICRRTIQGQHKLSNFRLIFGCCR